MEQVNVSVHQDRMRLAIEAARAAVHDGGVAIGAVLVDAGGRVVAQGGSLVGPLKDPTAHAEINAIRARCRELATDDLYGHTLYSTLEPCHMCLSCTAWARIGQVYFGAYRRDVDSTLFEVSDGRSDEAEADHMNLRESERMKAQGGVLEAECAELLRDYHDKPRHSG